jgi:hypothetical protein
MNALNIIGWVLLLVIWTSMYLRSKKFEQGLITPDTAHTWAVVNLVAAVGGFMMFIVNLFVIYFS